MSEYQLVPAFDRSTLDDYVALFHTAFAGDGKLSRDYLSWQYCDNPHGRVVGMDAYHGATLAAHYAIIPRRYGLHGVTHSAALSVNTATHPEHQGKGLFIKLATATYERAAAAGIDFVVGVANANSVGGFLRRLGFAELGQVRLHVLAAPPVADEDALDLQLDDAFLAWRLANPSRRYASRRGRDGSRSLSTSVKGVPFALARIPARLAGGIDLPDAGLMPALTPVFGPGPAGGVRLPLRFQPSPWHVIWKTLGDPDVAALAPRLRMTGLSMDTF